MSKPTNKSINYLRLAVVIAVIVGVLCGFIVWLLLSTARQEIVIPVVSSQAGEGKGKLSKGDLIDAADLDTESIGKYGLSPHIITDPNVLVGKFVNRDYYAGEHFWDFNIVADYPKTLSERIRYAAVPVPVGLITSVNADIQEDDFVKVCIIVKKDKEDTTDYESTDVTGKLPDSGVTIIEAEELQAVRVVGFYDAGGADITAAKRANNFSKDPASFQALSPSFIVFDANPIQQALLLQGIYGGQIQLIIIPDEQQIAKKREWGLIDDELKRVENPIFVDDSKEIAQRQAELEQAAENVISEENAKIDKAIDLVDQNQTPQQEDPNLANSNPPAYDESDVVGLD